MNWQLIWQIVFVGLMLGFTGMSLLVIVNGARDVRRLLQRLDEEHSEASPGE